MKKLIYVMIILFAFITGAFAETQVFENLKTNLDELINLYNLGISNTTKKKKFSKISHKIFNFSIISRLAVARGWKKFTKEEKEEFIDVFSKLLINTYYDKLKHEKTDTINIKINYIAEKKLSDTKILIKTKVLIINKKTSIINIDYKLIEKKQSWKVYDIKVEGISLVKNYREQFVEILMKNSPAYLISKIKKINLNSKVL